MREQYLTTTESESNGIGFASYFGTFAMGAAVGAAIALLTAPRTGAETREQLKHTAHDLGQTFKHLPDTVRQAGQRAVRAGREAFEQAREEMSGPGRSTDFS